MATKRESKLSEYHDILEKKLKGRRGEFLYRGQEDSDWRLRSGAVRRMLLKGEDTDELREFIKRHKEGFDFSDENLRYHEELLEQAKLRGWHRESGGRKLEDLEILAKLQHHGAATCLLDFTTRFDVALWFACKKVRDEDKDGKVFIVDMDSFGVWNLWRIGSNDLECDISKILRFGTRKTGDKSQMPQAVNEPKFWYWHPETLMGRMLSQGSRFLFGLEGTPDDDKGFFTGENIFDIKIKKEHKKQLLDELKQHHGLSQENIFFDIHGFATINNHQAPFRWRDAKDYFDEGLKKIQIGNFLGAVKDFSGVINLNSNHAGAYHNRSWSYLMLDEYDKACEDLEVYRDLHNQWGNQKEMKFAEDALQTLREIIADSKKD